MFRKFLICLYSLFLYCLICGCKDGINKKLLLNNSAAVKGSIIVLQPLGNFPKEMLSFLEDSIQKFYPVKIYTAPAKSIPQAFYYTRRNRYRADSIIHWLKQHNPDSVRATIAVTTYDISAAKERIKDYGVMGLGYQPGNASVVSVFRMRKGNPSERILRERLFKTVAHELGHNFGLPHCENQTCIMTDAEGKLKQDTEVELCIECGKKLNW